MFTTLIFTALLACGSSETPAPAPEAAPAPAPAAPPVLPPAQPDSLPPATEAQGGPLVVLPGNYLPDELKLGDGEAVQTLCKDRLVEGRVSLIPVGEGRVMPTVPQCPNFQILFRGLQDRMGNGSIKPGIGRGPFGSVKPRTWEAGHVKGELTSKWKEGMKPGPDTPYTVFLEPEGQEPIELVTLEKGTGTSGLNWIGDLDDDGVPDLIINTPHTPEEAHLWLFLSASSDDRKPEKAADFRFTLW